MSSGFHAIETFFFLEYITSVGSVQARVMHKDKPTRNNRNGHLRTQYLKHIVSQYDDILMKYI